jgi:hypothetical protein
VGFKITFQLHTDQNFCSPDTIEKQEYSETEAVSCEHGNEPSGSIKCW